MNERVDIDPVETTEWLDALFSVKSNRGIERASFLVETILNEARRDGLCARAPT